MVSITLLPVDQVSSLIDILHMTRKQTTGCTRLHKAASSSQASADQLTSFAFTPNLTAKPDCKTVSFAPPLAQLWQEWQKSLHLPHLMEQNRPLK